VGVSAADGVAAELPSVGDRPFADLVAAAEEDFAAPLRELREVVRPVEPLQPAVGGVRKPGRDGIALDELIELVPVQE